MKNIAMTYNANANVVVIVSWRRKFNKKFIYVDHNCNCIWWRTLRQLSSIDWKNREIFQSQSIVAVESNVSFFLLRLLLWHFCRAFNSCVHPMLALCDMSSVSLSRSRRSACVVLAIFQFHILFFASQTLMSIDMCEDGCHTILSIVRTMGEQNHNHSSPHTRFFETHTFFARPNDLIIDK